MLITLSALALTSCGLRKSLVRSLRRDPLRSSTETTKRMPLSKQRNKHL
jgi:hypothetical protein